MTDQEPQETEQPLEGNELDLVNEHTSDGTDVIDGVTPVAEVNQDADPTPGSEA